MARQPSIGRSELEILRHVVDHHPITVREVADHMAETRGQARTTALTVLERLRRKGYLTRELVEGIYRYSPSQSKADLLGNLVRDFVHSALGGSLSPFVAYLSREAELTPAEVDDLRRILREHESPPGEEKRDE